MRFEYAPRSAPEPGTRIVHRRYIDHAASHYAGNLVSGGYVVSLFNDIATDLCIHVDHDEGLFASYDEVTFHGPLLAGDVLEVSAELVNVGRRSRTVRFEAAVLARSSPEEGATASRVLAQPVLITTATGTVVTPTAYKDSFDA